LFGGKLEVQASKGLILIDDWVQLAANARIGALIGGLRRKMDELLAKKVKDPSFDLGHTVEMKLITNLLRNDGL
jgi:ATP-dependent RNA helicase DHX57